MALHDCEPQVHSPLGVAGQGRVQQTGVLGPDTGRHVACSPTLNGDSHSQNNQSPFPLFFQVPEIIQLICYHIERVTDKAAQSTIRKIFLLLVQSHTDEVILTLSKTEDLPQRLPVPSATHL